MSDLNYALLILSFVLCAAGLTIAYVYLEPFGVVLDGLGFMLFLYVIFTRNKEEDTFTAEATYRSQRLDKELERRRVHVLDRGRTWICPECKAINMNEEKVCYNCKQLRVIPSPQES